MKVFQSIQSDCEFLGIIASKYQKNHQLTLKSCITFLTYILGTASCGYYFCFIDKLFEQYIRSYIATTSSLVCVLQYINRFFCEDGKHRGITWVNDKNSYYFAHSNWKANNGSQRFWIKIPGQQCAESMDIYSKAIRWSELCYRIVNIVLVRITVVAFILPLYITCMYTYYSSTIPSKDAFVLTYYMWYVKITPTKNTTVKLFLARLHIIGYHLIGKIHSDILSYV